MKRARKSLYVLLGSMAAALGVLRMTTRALDDDSSAVAPPVTGSLARLASDPRHSQGDEIAHWLNSAEAFPRLRVGLPSGAAIRRHAAPPVCGSYAALAADPRHAAGNVWVAQLLEPRTRPNEQARFLTRRAGGHQQPVGEWSGWSGCSPYAAGRDHLGRLVHAAARASLSFRRKSAADWASVPVVTPARAHSARR
jgi:hypothetical protein